MTQSTQLEILAHLIGTVRQLRAPDGCPWDRVQTHQSLRQYLIEEAHEVLDVLDQLATPEDLKREPIQTAFREELGDLLMQILLHSELASEAGAFNFLDVAATLDEKLIRRHPHVFAKTEQNQVHSPDDVLKNWEKQKAQEKAHKPESSVLEGVPKGLPALQKAARIIEKVTKVGFQWNDMHGPLAKLDEELREMKDEVLALESLSRNAKEGDVLAARKKLEGEVGDLLFTLANVASLMKINPEDALRATLRKFESRFRFVEKKLKEMGKTPDQSDLPEMDRFWEQAKAQERDSKS
ncbi:nucleoside triphosphate pyrophosphohydrolase [Bdellovibrionota bacterium FG-1]